MTDQCLYLAASETIPCVVPRTKCTFPTDVFGNRKYYVNVHMVALKKEHHVVTKILEFEVDFQGYNSEIQLGGTSWAFLWPRLPWTVEKI